MGDLYLSYDGITITTVEMKKMLRRARKEPGQTPFTSRLSTYLKELYVNYYCICRKRSY